MQDDAHDLEEVVLFPDLPVLAVGDLHVADEPPSAAEAGSLPALREWLTVQLAHLDGQMRKQSGVGKPAGITAEIAAYIQAREVQASRKAAKDAYMKALHKLDHFARSL